MRFLVSGPLFAILLLTGTAGAQTMPIFPDSGGELCCCPTAWIVDKGGKPYCQVPPGVGLIALPEAEDKARTERMQAEPSHGVGGSGMTGGRGGYLGPCGAKTCQ